MNRYQITADIDATVWLGVLEDFQYAPRKIDYKKLKEFFTFGGIYIPSHNELENQLATLSKDIKKEFKLYLREIADERKFGVYILDVQLPLGDEAFISKHGTASVFVNGTFEVVMDMNVSTECIRDIVSGALDRALDAVYQSSDYLSACDRACLDVQKTGD
jgi:hypothetical protein